MAKKKGKGAQQKQARSLVKQAEYDVSLAPELLERARRDIKREKYLTPFKVHQKYNVSLSTARKLLKALEEEGLIVKFTPNRRSPIYVPKEKLPKLTFQRI
ncbi:MAG: 30S ribosomal protein S25e [Desulfurococcales archaeon]|nr:30S ribosomal protein S25e [Desulfurococcales archaeon]